MYIKCMNLTNFFRLCHQGWFSQIVAHVFSMCTLECTKTAILSWRPIRLAILLYEHFKHLTQINLHPNTQFLSTQHRAFQSFLVSSWIDSVCVTLSGLVNVLHVFAHFFLVLKSKNNNRAIYI